MILKLVSAGLFFLFIFLTGFWLSRKGKPHNILLSTVHKLIGLGMGIFLALSVYRVHQVTPLTPVQIVVLVITVLFFAINVATGSLLSAEKPMPIVVSFLNKFMPYLTILSTAALIVLVF